jgi:hypothetical protein
MAASSIELGGINVCMVTIFTSLSQASESFLVVLCEHNYLYRYAIHCNFTTCFSLLANIR